MVNEELVMFSLFLVYKKGDKELSMVVHTLTGSTQGGEASSCLQQS